MKLNLDKVSLELFDLVKLRYGAVGIVLNVRRGRLGVFNIKNPLELISYVSDYDENLYHKKQKNDIIKVGIKYVGSKRVPYVDNIFILKDIIEHGFDENRVEWLWCENETDTLKYRKIEINDRQYYLVDTEYFEYLNTGEY